MNKKLIAGVALFAVLAAASGYKLFAPKEKGITATGTIEVTRADITAKVSGYIQHMSFQAGDRVKNGQVMLTIDRPDLKAQLLRDEAALAKARAQLDDLVKGSRSQEKEEAAASLTSARAVYEKAKLDWDRYRMLYAHNAISAQQLDAAQSAYEVAHSSLQTAESQQSLVNEGNRADVIEAQKLEVARSKAIVAASRTQVDDTTVHSPLNGLILTKNFENGEYVNAGVPIATVGDMSDAWVKIYVASSQLGLLKIGQPAIVKIDSFPDRKFQGEIKEISQNAEFTPRQSITERERANLVFAVKVKIDNRDGLLKPGMPADVVLQ
ncbi:rnd efflux pump membrane fusion protein barrel-sandwich domain [Lucifera butyrica]|uniref:Rnd efflux pump membrane fusion protein barrel-sandwich domain n=1 Tax=Lucifera butyrica TaxID=1351585 RepID=A0A498R4J1_9FIRM|nr:efflux RND transporter periplasmic adaptor subunit [Lucifera butyrica]VBB06354.1 rnd efflux pump membrane fusion protein barrel-sandwich domain [Lucifera butyrica]